MKYVAIVVVIIMFVRIDILLEMFDKATKSFEPSPPEIENTDIDSRRELIPVSKDQNLKQTPREDFLALLEIYRISPDASIRERAMEIFKNHPTIFTEKLDKTLESQIYRWREHLNNNEPETVNFLLDLMNILKGENLEMIKRFFALWMEIDMGNFIAAYSRTRDSNCTIATTFGDRIPEEEKIKELYDREDALKSLLTNEKLNPVHRALAKNCLLVLSMTFNKPVENTSPITTPEPETAPEPSAQPVIVVPTPEGTSP